MTKTEADQIAKLLKAGKQYKQGHYQHGYEYFEYDEINKTFNYRREDYGTDFFNPELSETKFSKIEFINKIIEDFDYKDMNDNIT